MTDNDSTDYIVPVVAEEVHADAVSIDKGGVRVTKRVEGHDEVLEQELRRGRAEIRRIKTNRVVDGPQPPHQEGNTLVIPVISEVLVVTKQWVVTEEIRVTRIEEVERVEQQVTVNRESADVERLDESGKVIASGNDVARQEISTTARAVGSSPESTIRTSPKSRRILSQTESILRPKNN